MYTLKLGMDINYMYFNLTNNIHQNNLYHLKVMNKQQNFMDKLNSFLKLIHIHLSTIMEILFSYIIINYQHNLNMFQNLIDSIHSSMLIQMQCLSMIKLLIHKKHKYLNQFMYCLSYKSLLINIKKDNLFKLNKMNKLH